MLHTQNTVQVRQYWTVHGWTKQHVFSINGPGACMCQQRCFRVPLLPLTLPQWSPTFSAWWMDWGDGGWFCVNGRHACEQQVHMCVCLPLAQMDLHVWLTLAQVELHIFACPGSKWSGAWAFGDLCFTYLFLYSIFYGTA